MKLLASLTLALAVGSSPALAIEQCRFISAKVDREACYERQAKELAAKRKPGISDNPRMVDSVERLKIEDDRLNARLKGICRGC